MSVTKFEEAISKGFQDSERAQNSFELREEVKRVSEALKFNNSRLLGVERMQEAIYNFMRKATELKRVDNLESTVEKFVLNVNKLNEVLSKFSDVDDPTRLAEGQRRLGDYVR
jgi:GTP1/Obg family GTP-binding protein